MFSNFGNHYLYMQKSYQNVKNKKYTSGCSRDTASHRDNGFDA